MRPVACSNTRSRSSSIHAPDPSGCSLTQQNLSPQTVPDRERLAGVEVLRGLCILSVVLHHIHLRFTLGKYPVDDGLPATLNQLLFWSGLYAVIAFFVISGFLITGLSIRRWDALPSIPAGSFYRMRMARILPCLILVLAVLSALHFLGVPGAEMRPERATLARSLFAALTFHMN